MRISDWSSDVCSSDLDYLHGAEYKRREALQRRVELRCRVHYAPNEKRRPDGRRDSIRMWRGSARKNARQRKAAADHEGQDRQSSQSNPHQKSGTSKSKMFQLLNLTKHHNGRATSRDSAWRHV